MIIIINIEFKPVILTPSNKCATRMVRVTMAMDSPTDKAILSMIFNCLKKTRVHANPGRKKKRINAAIALTAGTLSRKGNINPNIRPISMLYVPFQSTLDMAAK